MEIEKEVEVKVEQSAQPEYFCTDCGAETSKAEDEAHAYLCDRCAQYYPTPLQG